MYLEKISLQNFKCYETLDIKFDKELTLIIEKSLPGIVPVHH